jgi:peptidyl-prolyl cis-trans isomerase SurA
MFDLHTFRIEELIRKGRHASLVAAFIAMALVPVGAQTPGADSSVTLDRIVAVVNRQAILLSDLEDEFRLAVLDPSRAGQSDMTPQQALQRLISRALIQQQIHEEDIEAVKPTDKEVEARLKDIRTELPACVRSNCSSEEGWKAFMESHGLTPERVDAYLRNRLEILRFIEMRFRQGIRISPEEIEGYYREKLVPLYPAGQTPPPLDQVSPRIEEILLQQEVNVLFDDWLDNLQKQGEVEVLDSSLAPPRTSEKGSGNSASVPTARDDQNSGSIAPVPAQRSDKSGAATP